jgi:ABC-2 type transport system permease protein
MSKLYWNPYGAYALYKREVTRFVRVGGQTILPPMINALLFLAIFVLAIGDLKAEIKGIPFPQFMGIGLLIMNIIQSTFSNPSSSIVISKVIGYVIDILMPPLSALEILIAHVSAAITRGLIVGFGISISMSIFISLSLSSPLLLIYYVINSCICVALIGILTGIIAQTFDQSNFIYSYIITPLTFLSCTFYPVDRLPHSVQQFNQFNPFFYMIDGFRYAMTGYNGSNIEFGMMFLLGINILLTFLVYYLLKIGWRIKS